MGLSLLNQPKRGYLANILTLPPLIYPFQYNPAQISDSKQIKYTKKTTVAQQTKGAGSAGGSVAGGAASAAAGTASGALSKPSFGDEVQAFIAGVGQTFSKADLHMMESEGDRTLNFKFTIDGREQRTGEPSRRRNDQGHILYDLAVLRSFVYPSVGDMLDVLGAIGGSQKWSEIWFKKPPSAILVMGSTSIEGFVTDLKVTETQFNSDLDPVRAEVEVTMIEKIDSISFILDSFKRVGRTLYATAYEDVGDVLF